MRCNGWESFLHWQQQYDSSTVIRGRTQPASDCKSGLIQQELTPLVIASTNNQVENDKLNGEKRVAAELQKVEAVEG